MKEQYQKWEDINWTQVEFDVFQTQRRIFRQSQANNRESVYSLQQLLTNSRNARLLAVRKAAQDSKGSSTPGVDGRKDLTEVQKLRLTQELSLKARPSPVRRTWIPKNRSRELRPLGIPTIADRALQHLIVLALEPEWEARYSPHQYGFRRGRTCRDALEHIRTHILRSPKWLLDADVEKFFDRISHEVILEKLNTWPRMHRCIAQILSAGVLEDGDLTPNTEGAPQGGPLSPLLANVVLAGLEEDISEAARNGGLTTDAKRTATAPRLVIYADDLVALHSDREIVESSRLFIDQWLRLYGLNLSQSKTRIAHTLESVDGQQAGFDFLGCRVQQFRVGKYALSPYFKGVWTDIRPSRDAVRRLLAEVKEKVRQYGPKKRRNAAYAYRMESGKAGPVEVLIINLNRTLRGWLNYHRSGNAKATFARVDHEIFEILWHWCKSTFPRRRRRELVDEFFNGGKPWQFRLPRSSKGEPLDLLKAADTPIQRHILVQSSKSFFDGDWAYWASRRGKYPSLPRSIAGYLKRQHGKCAGCQQRLKRTDRLKAVKLMSEKGRPYTALQHHNCDD